MAIAYPTAVDERAPVLDVLRGIALLGIVIVNMEFYAQPVDWGWVGAEGLANDAARWLSIALFQGKSYLVFSLLFGYGTALQVARAGDGPFGRRYARRLIGLFALGALHAVLLFSGDILMAYAVLGAVLVPLRRVGDRELAFVAAALAALSAIGYVLAGGALAVSGGFGALGDGPDGAVRAIAEGGLAEQIGQRVSDLPTVQGAVLAGQGPMVAAAYLVGVVMARHGLLHRTAQHRAPLRRLAGWCLPIGLAGSVLAATLIVGVGGGIGEGVGTTLQFASAPFASIGVVAGIALLVDGGRLAGPARRLAAVGRMSLTVYLLESTLAALLFTGLGFGLYGEIGPAVGLVLAVTIWLVLALGAQLWWRAFRFGPFEWLLRSFSYWHLQPLRARRRSP